MDEQSTSPPGDTMRRQPEEEPDRRAQPVDAEQPPRLPFAVVGIGASAGGLEAVSEFLDALRPDGGMAVVLVQHLAPDRQSQMAEILARRTAMPVLEVEDGMAVQPNHVYVIRPGHVMTIRQGHLHLGPPLGSPRAANRPVDDFFRSLAEEQRERAICIVMSGMGSNGTAGTQAVKAVGGLCVAQDPESAQFPSMPTHMIDAGYADYILRPAEMPEVVLAYAGHPYARGDRETDAEAILGREQHHLHEILTLLRTRTRHDFAGYKKPTLLRRFQRRMGLARLTTMAEYANLLRQVPTEVTALADDLLIHVTGFFRDPEAWDALRRKVVAPLVDSIEPNGSVRAWVTACSSGEEAYSLAMILVEEAERAGNPLDIKVFATDLAGRALAHARAGVYPGGIESEIPPEQLERFFTRDDEVYRVRAELRNCVVFAPQNVLQDPPFSRLDIATCRNLMIYLEPEVQQRVLALLHFGLREGGALFLGAAETVAGADDLFQTIDKKARIFRRVGPTRHGSVEFPLAHALLSRRDGVARPMPSRADAVRPSIAQLTQRTLLERHTPAAVTVDRHHRIVYFHGDSRPFLQQPSGEPTRDLMLLLREGVRGAVRVALHRAAAQAASATVLDGWAEIEPGRRVCTAIVASPVVAGVAPGESAGPPDYFVVSFEERGDFVAPSAPDGAGDGGGSTDETLRLRAELQHTIQELQTSNEELRASNEEVMSINEEFQSANEELETSKEEMQSLNEELTTVNAQLRTKMEEHQTSSSDLASLLTSTDIAVLFLDTGFRIRRFTPAVRGLFHLIASDVGRPLENLHRRFDDPHLADDALAVLERLVPAEREVSADDGRHYLRRVLPYRTTDDRIDGLVVTFVDITDRHRAERARQASEERLRLALEAAGMGSFVWHPVEDRGEPDGRMLALFGLPAGSPLTLGAGLSALIHPADRERYAAAVTRATDPAGDGRLSEEIRVVKSDGAERWLAVAGRTEFGGEPRRAVRLAGVAADVTSRKQAEQALRASEARQAFLARLADALRPLSDPVQYQATACRLLGEHLRANRVFYAEVWREGEHAAIHHDYTDGLPSIAGRLRLEDFGPPMTEEYRNGRTVAIADGPADPRLTEEELLAFAAIALRAFVGVPVVKDGHLVGVFGVHQAEPRVWTSVELELIEETAERTWAAVERARAEAAVRERDEQFRRAIEDSPIPVIMHAEDGEVLQISRSWTELTGYTLTDVPTLSAWLTQAYGPGAEAVRDHVHELFQGTRRTVDLEFAVRTRGGAERYWSFSASAPGTLRDGRRFVVGMAVDITDRRRAEEDLRRGEERLRLALAAARMGTWTWTMATGEQTRDENLNRLLGLEPVETGQPLSEFLRHIHPDDREAVALAFDTSVRLRQPLNVEFRVVQPDGTRRWLRDQGDIVDGDGGDGVYMAGACVDVTALKEAEAALRASEERLRLIVSSTTDYAIFTLDADRRVTGWNPGAEAIFGYAEREIVGRSCDIIFTLEDRAAGAPEDEAGTALREGRAADERWHLRKDGSRFYASGVLTRMGEVGSPGFVKVLRDLTDRKRMEDDLREARDELEARVAERTSELTRSNEARVELLRRLVKAQEDERRRVSRELHDGLGQELTALILSLKALEETIPEGAPGRDLLREVEAGVGRIGGEAHDLAVEIRPTALDDIGLGSALATYVARWSERTGVAAEFQSTGHGGDRLPPEVETAIYRVVQEALNNVAKHAAARQVSVIVERREGELTALVEDDGRGFDPARVGSGPDRHRLGLLGMRERAALVGGTLLIESSGGAGTTVRARIPLHQDPAEADNGD